MNISKPQTASFVPNLARVVPLQQNGLPGLPKTIEMATVRYLEIYSRYYRGDESEKLRLLEYGEQKILKIKRKAPHFYEERLPALINQAANLLLICNVETEDGAQRFHQQHRYFLKILDDLRQSQPPGEVNFENEVRRIEQKDSLIDRMLKLRAEIDKLEATEISLEDLGEDDGSDSAYIRYTNQIDELKSEYKKINLKIASLEGENIEEDITFELKFKPTTLLSKLSSELHKNIEKQILDFHVTNKKNRDAFLDVDYAMSIIAKLDLTKYNFSKEDTHELAKEIVDANKLYFREKVFAQREMILEDLLNNQALKPKEGIIIEDPDDVPEDVKVKFVESERQYKRKMEELEAECKRHHPGDEEAEADMGEEIDRSPDDEDPDYKSAIEEINSMPEIFKRVKEEPLDGGDSEEEPVEENNPLEGLDDDDYYDNEEDEDDDDDDGDERQGKPFKEGDNEDDDGFEMLGVVEPKAKVEEIVIDSDDD